MDEPQKWIRMDWEDGWQIVVPETDSKPHGFSVDGKSADLASFDCPCKPRIEGKIIIHNSLDVKEALDKQGL